MPTRRGSRHRPFDHGEPIKRIVLAPIAGPVLIAATLIASTYGVRTHAVEIDLPFPSQEPSETRLGLSPDLLRIDRSGRIFWNGEPIAREQLQDILASRQRGRKSPGLRFSPDPDASYESALGALSLVKISGNAEAGFCFHNHHLYGDYGLIAGRSGPLPDRAPFACDPSKDGRFDLPLPPMPRH